MRRKLTKAEQERFNAYLVEFRKLSWNAYLDQTTALQDENPEDPRLDDEAYSRACSAFERHRCPYGAGRGAVPMMLRWNYRTGEWLVPDPE